MNDASAGTGKTRMNTGPARAGTGNGTGKAPLKPAWLLAGTGWHGQNLIYRARASSYSCNKVARVPTRAKKVGNVVLGREPRPPGTESPWRRSRSEQLVNRVNTFSGFSSREAIWEKNPEMGSHCSHSPGRTAWEGLVEDAPASPPRVSRIVPTEWVVSRRE
jgi:hypothetical protein